MDANGPGERMSMGARLLNVVAAPGELFDALARAPFSVANWLVPATLLAMVGVVCQLIVFSQPALVQQVRDAQDRAIQAKVEDGSMKPAEAEKAKEIMAGVGMTIARVAGAASMVIYGFLWPFWWAFLAWVVARTVLRAPLPFGRALEVAGLVNGIGLLAMLVGTFLGVGLGQLFAGPHAGVFVKDFDLTRRTHLALGALNLFSFWQLAVLSLGVARLTERRVGVVAVALGGIWAGYKALAVLLKLSWLAL